MVSATPSLDIDTLLDGYRLGHFTPREIINSVLERIRTQPEHNTWITRLTPEQIEPWLAALDGESPETRPLYGVPFAIKDNIDLAGIPTTAACAAYAYEPDRSAFVVQRLIDAGAIPIGKTNLDQFATGLVGTRSPYGPGRNSFNPDYVSGGSSAGSATSVALGQVSFSLGTDTAGSGRVPAAFNNLVGLKPSRGLLSTSGVVPACRTLDCVSVFALTCGDAARVLEVVGAFDESDAWARPAPRTTPFFATDEFTFGVPQPAQLNFLGDGNSERLYREAITRLQGLGGRCVEIDFEPFLEAARLLYEGPWVSERYAAIEDFITTSPDELHPVTRQIIAGGATPSAVAGFKARYRLAECRRHAERVLNQVDCMMTPTAGTIYRISEVEADPVQLNSNLGYYTNFLNLLDLAGIAVPAGFTDNGLPFGITLVAPAFTDQSLLALADRFHCAQQLKLGATSTPLPDSTLPVVYAPPGTLPIAVCGAHLTGLPLNPQLTERGAVLLECTHTAASYRLYALPGGPPHRPALVRDSNGSAIEVEVWALPLDRVGSFLDGIPAPLGLGKLELADGRLVTGFICEPGGIEGSEDITHFGSWRAYLA